MTGSYLSRLFLCWVVPALSGVGCFTPLWPLFFPSHAAGSKSQLLPNRLCWMRRWGLTGRDRQLSQLGVPDGNRVRMSGSRYLCVSCCASPWCRQNSPSAMAQAYSHLNLQVWISMQTDTSCVTLDLWLNLYSSQQGCGPAALASLGSLLAMRQSSLLNCILTRFLQMIPMLLKVRKLPLLFLNWSWGWNTFPQSQIEH